MKILVGERTYNPSCKRMLVPLSYAGPTDVESATRYSVCATDLGHVPLAGRAVVRPAATPLEPTSTLAGVSASTFASGLQADFNKLLSSDTSVLSYDGATNASAVVAFLQANQPRLRSVNVTPTITSATSQLDGSQLVTFTVQVTFLGGIWPTNLGTVTASLNPAGTVTFPHETLCALASPLMEGCPF